MKNKSTPNPDISQLQIDIDLYIARLEDEYNIKNGVVDRLKEIRDNLDNQASEWFYMDLYSVINPTLLLEQARDLQREKSRWWLGVVEVFRNFLVLVPILLTWYALSQASMAYANSVESDLPFLILWEGGFGGKLPEWLTFSQVARWDVLILLAVIVTTIIVHVVNNIQFERIEHNLVKFVAEFDNLLWRINKVLVQGSDTNTLSQKLLNDISGFVDAFRQQGEDFHDLLSAEQNRLQKLNEFRLQDLQEFDVVSKSLMNSVGQLINFSSSTSQALQDVQQAVSTLTVEAHAISKSHDGLDKSLKSFDGRLGAFEKVLEQLIHTVDEDLTSVGYSTQVELSKLTSLSEDLGNSVKKLSENQEDLVQIISREKTTDNALIKETRETAIQMKFVGEKLEGLSQNYETLSKQVVGMHDGTVKMLDALSGNLKQFNELITPVNANYQQSLTQLGSAINSMEKTYSEMNATRGEFTNAHHTYQVATQSSAKSIQLILAALTEKRANQSPKTDADLSNLIKELRDLNTILRKKGLFSFLGIK